MRNFKNILKCTIFVAIVCVVFGICDFVFVPSGYVRFILHTLNSPEENYDCVILGASHGRSAINPYKLDEVLGTNTINVCIPSETVEDSYYLLKESDRNNDIKKVILDLDYQYWYDLAENDFSDAFIYYQMEPSKVKAEYFLKNLVKQDFRITCTRWSNYINNFSGIKNNISIKSTDEYKNYDVSGAVVKGADGPYVGKGFFYRGPGGHGARGLVPKYTWNENTVDQKVVGWFEKIIEYCKTNDIELVCITSTITPATVLTKTAEDSAVFFNKLTQEHGVEYYDFNLLRQNVMSRTNLDFGDWDGHMCGELADRYSTIVASVIQDGNDGKMDRTKYFYDSYEDLYEDVDTVIYCETIPKIVENKDGTYAVNFDIDALTGTGIEPEFKVIVGTTETCTVISEYCTNTKYSLELPQGTYTLRVESRAVGSTAAFEEYCEKQLKVGE